MLRETHYTYEERLKALMDLKPIDIQDHSAILLSELSIDALIAGNVTKEVSSIVSSHRPSNNSTHNLLLE
jgi:secreted Zn-dependent insulinase-like peptidase